MDEELIEAVKAGNLQKVKELVERGADVNVTDETDKPALICAYDNDCLDVAKYLIEHGADINAKDFCNETVLMYACEKGHFEFIKYLVEHGADVNARAALDKNTALMCAYDHGYLDIANYLIEKGADVNAKDNLGCTVLMYACEKGPFEFVKYLVEQGADVNAGRGIITGNTALMRTKDKKIAWFLIELHGADVNARNMDGNTALDLAKNNKEKAEVFKLLQKYESREYKLLEEIKASVAEVLELLQKKESLAEGSTSCQNEEIYQPDTQDICENLVNIAEKLDMIHQKLDN